MDNLLNAAYRLVGQAFHNDRGSKTDSDEKNSSNEGDTTISRQPNVGNADSIVKTAASLTRKLPGDIIPSILDHAEMWIPMATARTDTAVTIHQSDAGTVVLKCELPPNMPPNVVRKIKLTTVSRDQGWSSYPDEQGTYRGSWTWFDIEVVKARDLRGQQAPFENEDIKETQQALGDHNPPWRRTVVTNIHAGREWKTHEVIWDLLNKDSEIADMMRQLRGGDIVQLSIWARYPGWQNRMQSASIEVEGVYVRKI